MEIPLEIENKKFKIKKINNTLYYWFPDNINDKDGNDIEQEIYIFTFLKEKGAYLHYSIFIKNFKIIISKIIDGNDKILFLLDWIYFINETKISFSRYKSLLNEIIYEAWKISKNLQIFNIEVAEQYLNLCLDDKNDDWFELKHLNREKEVEAVANFLIKIMPDLENKDFEKAKMLLRDARTWLLKRYDIDKAAEIQFGKNTVNYYLAKTLPEIIGLIVFISLITVKWGFWENIKLPTFDFIYRGELNIVLLTGYVGIFGFAFYIRKKVEPGLNQFQILLPRLIAGIVVGYFALMTDESWNGVFSRYLSFTRYSSNFNILLFIMKIILPLILVYVYLLVEISNVKGVNSAKQKAFRILVRGFSYSILIGVIFSDFFGDNLINRMAENGIAVKYYFKGVLGNIYPEAILLLSPLALFIGVFVQLLWEDKAVTEKI